MSVYVEIQVETAIHRFVMKDHEAGLALVKKLQPYVGKPMFSRNDDEPRNMLIQTEDGEGFITLERIHAVRVVDLDVFDAADEERRHRHFKEMRQIDIELLRNFVR